MCHNCKFWKKNKDFYCEQQWTSITLNLSTSVLEQVAWYDRTCKMMAQCHSVYFSNPYQEGSTRSPAVAAAENTACLYVLVDHPDDDGNTHIWNSLQELQCQRWFHRHVPLIPREKFFAQACGCLFDHVYSVLPDAVHQHISSPSVSILFSTCPIWKQQC